MVFFFFQTAAMPSMKQPRYEVKNLAKMVEIREAVREGKLSCQTNMS